MLLNVLEEATMKVLWNKLRVDKLGTLYQSKSPIKKISFKKRCTS